MRAAARVGDHNEILDPYATHTGEVHAGLDGEHLTGLEDSGVVLADGWKFMDVESDTVAGSMTEGLAEPGFGDDRSTTSSTALASTPGATAATAAA